MLTIIGDTMKRISAIKKYYDKNMETAEEEHEILGWESKEAQYARFAALKDNVDLNGMKLLDVGCGLGNLYEYLKEEKVKVKYTGVDILPSMIDSAKSKGLDCELLCADVFEDKVFKPKSFNVVYSSGIFNLNLGNNKDFLKKAITRFMELATDYLCFNLLHYKSPNREDTYYYFSPEEAVGIIKEVCGEKAADIKIIEDYLKNDFTVICKKV